MNMKKLMLGGIAALGAITLVACSNTPTNGGGETDGGSTPSPDTSTEQNYEGETLVVTSWGGDWETAFIEGVVEPFEAETGASVELITLYSADALAQVTAQAANPQIDVVLFSGGQEYVAAQEGLIEAIDPSNLPTHGDLADFAVEGLERGEGPVFQMSALGLVFNTESGAPTPDSWLDIFSEDYAGHIALTDYSNTWGVLSTLRIADENGDSIENPEPTIEQLGALAANDDAIVIASSPDLQAAFAQRDIWLAPYTLDYAGTLKDAGLPVEFIVPKEGAGASIHTANVVSGRDNIELSTLFVDYTLRPEAQQVFAEKMRYSPTNLTVELSGERAEEVITGDALLDVVTYAPGDVAEGRADWTALWNSIITQ